VNNLDLVDVALLRARYAEACECYRVHAAKLAEHAEGGQALPKSLLNDEQQALYALATARRELLDALAATSQPDYDTPSNDHGL
jgi:hypothetical protein